MKIILFKEINNKIFIIKNWVIKKILIKYPSKVKINYKNFKQIIKSKTSNKITKVY